MENPTVLESEDVGLIFPLIINYVMLSWEARFPHLNVESDKVLMGCVTSQ